MSDSGIFSEEGDTKIRATRELNYLTHFVIRLFELPSKEIGINVDDASKKGTSEYSSPRFRAELLFSPGAAIDPVWCYEQSQKIKQDVEGLDRTKLEETLEKQRRVIRELSVVSPVDLTLEDLRGHLRFVIEEEEGGKTNL